MPQVLEPLAAATGARFELMVLANPLFGASVTCAGLLPGAAFQHALAERHDLDLALIPHEALNEEHTFLDGITIGELGESAGCPVRPSYCFTDALGGREDLAHG